MIQHDFTSIDCWCAPRVETSVCEDDHPSTYTVHVDENGNDFAYLVNDDPTPYCADCDAPMVDYLPDPDWLLAKGVVNWRLMRTEEGDRSFSWGFDLIRSSESEVVCLVVSFGKRRLALDILGRRRRIPVGDQTEEMAPGMIEEIERHLREHGNAS